MATASEHELEHRTLRSPPGPLAAPARQTLTIAMHPRLRRIGERVALPGGRMLLISRLAPEFRATDGQSTGPLADPYVSRTPLALAALADGGALLRADPRSVVRIDGRPVHGDLRLDADALTQGVAIDLAGRVVLLLHRHRDSPTEPPKYGLVGESAAIQRLREDITLAAVLPISVLIRGESGTGKELVARAIHAASARAARPYVALNMAALNPQTAVAELFGHARGSFTGAIQAREGYFREAHGGTLFLDEIGEATVEVQAMLLRALETGEVQPVGGGAARPVDVRVLAATDADLEAAVHRAGFRLALLHRLAGLQLQVPPLRQRADDIMRLLVHQLAGELQRAGHAERFAEFAADACPRLTTRTVVRLLRDPWPGNVRQLGNTARQMAAALLVGRPLDPTADVDPAPDVGAAGPVRAVARPLDPTTIDPPGDVRMPARPAGDLTNERLVAALSAHQWNVRATARHLGVSRNTLYMRMERCPGVRKARDIADAELAAAYTAHDGDLERTAEALRVSLRGLQLRVRELKLAP